MFCSIPGIDSNWYLCEGTGGDWGRVRERQRGERREEREREGENVCMCEKEVGNMMVHEHQVRTNWESKSG